VHYIKKGAFDLFIKLNCIVHGLCCERMYITDCIAYWWIKLEVLIRIRMCAIAGLSTHETV